MRKLKMTVAYDGSGYKGFQKQKGTDLPTIQDELEKAWRHLTGESVAVTGAGRTDTGVHADGQVVHFSTENDSIPAKRVPYAMNGALPGDIRVIACEQVPGSFHAQYDAVSREYAYRILNVPFPLPRLRHDTYFVSQPLDVEAMQRAAAVLVGTHDFRAFAAAGHHRRSTVRHLMRCDVLKEKDIIMIYMKADGFLQHMVRTIAGSLLLVGEGKADAGWVKRVLLSKDRRQAGRTLPGKGLTLQRVNYA